ncbi:RidA family protein [Paractinoplanes ferrugineus]|uniref:Endoribonuclease n=1 Tax=Paractinoplanes ferrugineus TaxID=113564 RepID=A0A919J3A9_9ACTN|nr:RidA family protein [Actinoplanes ferrugineus]GIE12884.1 endoribonuclease [Actinoplanes ferrugineus]
MTADLANPPTAAAPFGDRFAHLARVGDTLFLSGQVAVDDAGRVIAPGDAEAQAERIFEIIRDVLTGYGATLADVAHIRTFMTSLDDLPAYAIVRRRLFPAPGQTLSPASTTVEVSRLFLPGAVLEIEVTAALPRGRRPRPHDRGGWG